MGHIAEAALEVEQGWKKYKDRIIEAFEDDVLSERYGWTPNEIDQLDHHQRATKLAIIRGEQDGRKQLQEEANRTAGK